MNNIVDQSKLGCPPTVLKYRSLGANRLVNTLYNYYGVASVNWKAQKLTPCHAETPYMIFTKIHVSHASCRKQHLFVFISIFFTLRDLFFWFSGFSKSHATRYTPRAHMNDMSKYAILSRGYILGFSFFILHFVENPSVFRPILTGPFENKTVVTMATFSVNHTCSPTVKATRISMFEVANSRSS